MDKIQAIHFFLKLAETLSFKRTAQHFGVPSSTISRSLKALEKQLGVALVERTTRRVRLTEAGEWYRGEVSGPLRALSAADELVQAQAREPLGTVRITALPGYAELRLFPVLDRFRAAYPSVLCDLELTDRYQDLSTGEIDVALRVTADPPDYLVAQRLHDHSYALVASPDYLARRGRPETVAAVADHAAVVCRAHGKLHPWLAVNARGDAVPVPRTPVLVTNHGLLRLEACLAGEGLALLPRWGVSDALREGRLEEVVLPGLRVVSSVGPAMSMYLLYAPSKARLAKVRVLVDMLVEGLSQE